MTKQEVYKHYKEAFAKEGKKLSMKDIISCSFYCPICKSKRMYEVVLNKLSNVEYVDNNIACGSCGHTFMIIEGGNI